MCDQVLSEEAAPVLAARDFILQLAFVWLSGNVDLHAKSISVIDRGSGYELSPVYGIASAVLYGDYSLPLEDGSGGENSRGGPAKTALNRGPVPAPPRAPLPRPIRSAAVDFSSAPHDDGAVGADGTGARAPRSLSRRDLLRAGVALPMIGAAWSVASCAAPVSRDGAEPSTSVPASSTSEKCVPQRQPADVVKRYLNAGARDWGLDLPGIVRTADPKPKTIALTFNACGGPKGSLVGDLLATLRELAVPATLFWNKRWIDANPQRARQIADNPLFQIENHGTLHKPLSVNGRSAYGIAGTATVAELVEEIEANRRFLREFLGLESNWFRPGTAFCDDVAVRIAGDLGVTLAGFAVNGDAGATAPGPVVASNLVHSAPGSIVIMYMNQPGHGTAEGVRAAISQLRAAGFTFVKLGAAPA